jgi:hypothetical protein
MLADFATILPTFTVLRLLPFLSNKKSKNPESVKFIFIILESNAAESGTGEDG